MINKWNGLRELTSNVNLPQDAETFLNDGLRTSRAIGQTSAGRLQQDRFCLACLVVCFRSCSYFAERVREQAHNQAHQKTR